MINYSQIIAWLDANWNTNGVGSNTGAKGNYGMKLLLTALSNLNYDETRPYFIGNTITRVSGIFTDIFTCTEDYGPGIFDASKFFKISKRSQKLTVNDNAFLGIEIGSNTFDHELENEDFTIYMKDASGYQIPIEIVHNTTSTQITIVSLVEYAGAKILISEI